MTPGLSESSGKLRGLTGERARVPRAVYLGGLPDRLTVFELLELLRLEDLRTLTSVARASGPNLTGKNILRGYR